MRVCDPDSRSPCVTWVLPELRRRHPKLRLDLLETQSRLVVTVSRVITFQPAQIDTVVRPNTAPFR